MRVIIRLRESIDQQSVRILTAHLIILNAGIFYNFYPICSTILHGIAVRKQLYASDPPLNLLWHNFHFVGYELMVSKAMKENHDSSDKTKQKLSTGGDPEKVKKTASSKTKSEEIADKSEGFGGSPEEDKYPKGDDKK